MHRPENQTTKISFNNTTCARLNVKAEPVVVRKHRYSRLDA